MSPPATKLIFLTPVPANKTKLFHTYTTYFIHPRLDSRLGRDLDMWSTLVSSGAVRTACARDIEIV